MLDASESLAHKLLKKGAWLYALTALIAPLGYFIRIVISGELTVEEFGLLYGVMAVVTLVWNYNDLGFTEALNYFLPKKAVAKDWAGFTRLSAYALAVHVVGSIAAGAALWVAAEPLGAWLFKSPMAADLLRINLLLLLGHALFQVPSTVFNALQDVKAAKGLELARLVSTLAFVAWVAWSAAPTPAGFAWAWVAGMGACGAAAAVLAVLRLRGCFDVRGLTWAPAEFVPVMRYAMWSVLAVNVGTLLSQLDTLFVIYFLGNAANGAYSNYLSLMNLVFFIVGPAIGFLFPVFSELHARGDVEKMRKLRGMAHRHLASLALYFGSFLFVFGPALAVLFFGAKFETSGWLMAWSGPFLAFNFLLQVNFMLLAGTGRARVRMVILLYGVALNLGTLTLFLAGVPWLGVPPIGLPGAALASGVGWVLIFLLSQRATREHASRFEWARFFPDLAAAVALAAAGWWAMGAVGLPETRLACLVPLAAGAALHILAWMAVNSRDLRAVYGEIRSLRAKGVRAEPSPLTVT